ncbi:MAG: hypothetical protein M3N82_02320 [Pseudomonadota bacterium]|nr:hypothetical protein [Pseudomonadota bacterium]
MRALLFKSLADHAGSGGSRCRRISAHFRWASGDTEAELRLSPGDLYEDCSFHPVVCVEVDYDRDEIFGISLIDGSYMRSWLAAHAAQRPFELLSRRTASGQARHYLATRERLRPAFS